MGTVSTLAYAPSDHRRATRIGRAFGGLTLSVIAVALLASATTDLALRFGPTRPAQFTGKRMAHGGDYRVSYSYDDGGRVATDTDHVARAFFFNTHLDTRLRVRTFGVSTFRFARLAGAPSRPGDRWSVAARWAAVGVAVGLLAAVRLRRSRPAPRAGGRATGTGPPPGP